MTQGVPPTSGWTAGDCGGGGSPHSTRGFGVQGLEALFTSLELLRFPYSRRCSGPKVNRRASTQA
jgi:hypothetical protein